MVYLHSTSYAGIKNHVFKRTTNVTRKSLLYDGQVGEKKVGYDLVNHMNTLKDRGEIH